MKIDNVIKTRILFGLWVVFVASYISVRADDNPAQAAARAALEQKLKLLDNPQPQPAPSTPSEPVVAQPAESATNATNITDTVQAPAVSLPAASAETVPAVAVVAVVPAATVASTNTQPAPVTATPPPAPALAVIKPSSPPVKLKATNEIVTIYGTVYKNAQVEKVEPDGLIISYEPPGGGVALSKIYFEDLSPEVRQQYQKSKRP